MNHLKSRMDNRIAFSTIDEELSEEEVSLIEAQNVDAILTLPIYHVGSEIENYMGTSNSMSRTFQLSAMTDIPIVSTYSSRVSASQFGKIKKTKETGDLTMLLGTKKILIIAEEMNIDSIEVSILDDASLLFEKDGISYASLSVKN